MIANAPYFKIESFGAVDGPGVRLVVFLQGCPLRCIYCHNPESWALNSKLIITPEEVINKFKRNRNYYRNGGITLSGGEPLIHQDFCLEVARMCHNEGISLAFDTSGASFNKATANYYKQLIKYKPLWIVDIKHINPSKHKLITGVANQNELLLIKFLEKNKQKYWVRQVLVPGYTDDPKDLKQLSRFISNLKYMTNFEILPYHKLGLVKYRDLKIGNLLVKVNEPSKLAIKKAKQLIVGFK